MELEELRNIISLGWNYETCSPGSKASWSEENPSLGQCAITALIVNDFFGGKIMRCMASTGSHYYNLINGVIVDFTKETMFKIGLYDYAEKYFHNKELFYYNQWCVVVAAIIEFLLIINKSSYLNTKLFLKKEQKKHLTDLPYLSNIVKDLEVYDTARFDIKNYGNEFNKVVILENTDEEAIIEKPKWFSNAIGEGVVVHSVCKKIKMTLQCIRSGQLKVFLRGKDVRNEDNERIPVEILYIKLLINNMPVFTKGRYIWYDQPFVYSKTVTDGELVEIEAEWTNVNEL